jgi:hypothetical protein
VRLGHVSKASIVARARDSGRERFCVHTTKRVKDEAPKISGGDIEEATPDPIPNSEVKLFGADGTAREAVWESRTLPGLFPSEKPESKDSGFLLLSARR